MKYLDEYRDKTLTKPLVKELINTVSKPLRVMEVCGSHTMAIFRNGLRDILPEGMELISGPGCPVCVTSASHMDAFIDIANRPGIRVAIFGDLFRVPGTYSSLVEASSQGSKVDIVYSPIDALNIAIRNPQELLVFLGVGFETTTPTVAATIFAAKNNNIDNFAVFSTQKTMPAPMDALLGDTNLKINAILCPGHVSAIIGAGAWRTIARKYNLACVVSGFETADLLKSLILLARQVADNDIKVENTYPRAVAWEPNLRAQNMVDEIFEPVDMDWRGLGCIPASGLKIGEKYKKFDAELRLDIKLPKSRDPKGCICGNILKGMNNPKECSLFDNKCTPSTPIGPCMVSSEGTCAAYHKYDCH